MRIFGYLGVMTLLLLLSACDSTRPFRGLGNSKIADSHKLDGDTDVYEIRLTDGTPCAVYDGFSSGGITCNWSQTP